MTAQTQVEMIADYACVCGEGPIWHPMEKRLYWTDIETGRMFHFDPATGRHQQCYEGRKVGGMTIQADGSMLLFRDKGNIVVFRDGRIIGTIIEQDPEHEGFRYNDVIADPEGRVFCGTLAMGSKNPGKLYRLDRNATLTPVVHGVGCANGMGFTDNNTKMYFTDSPVWTIYLFDYNRQTGAISNRRSWAKTPSDQGYPDGMTVDAEGNVWTAKWDGSAVVRLNREGREIGRISVPAKKASSVTFAGDDCTDMYITTAGGDKKETDGPLAGALFRAKSGVRGVPEYLSRIGI